MAEKWANYRIYLFAGHWTSVTEDSDPWEVGKSEVSQIIAQFQPWESFQIMAQGGGLKQSLVGSLSWKDGKESLGRLQHLEFTRQSNEKEKAAQRENTRNLQREDPCPVFSWVLISTCMWENCERPEKDPSGGTEVDSAWRSHKTCPTCQTGKPHESQD